MRSDTTMIVGLILFIVGIIMFLAYYPTYVSQYKHLLGYETPILTEEGFEYFILIDGIVMPLLHIFIALGIALMLLGGLSMLEKKRSLGTVQG